MIKYRNLPTILDLKIVGELFTNKHGTIIKDLAKNLKVDYKNVYDAVDKLFRLGVINRQKLGNYNICKLNYSNEDIPEYLMEFNWYIKKREFKRKYLIEYNIINQIIKECLNTDAITPSFICVLFGSYAKSEIKSDSDIDLLFISHGVGFDADLKKIIDKINAPYQKKFHIINQDVRQFIKDLNQKNKVSVATELYKYTPIIFHGDDIFFKIMIEFSKLW